MADPFKVLGVSLCVFSVLALLNTLYEYTHSDILLQPHIIYKHFNQTNFIAMYPTNPRGIRLGNQIFQFASVVGIAEMNGLVAVIACDHYLKGIFDISVPCVNKTEITGGKGRIRKSEREAAIYTKSLETLGFTRTVIMRGYLQSWRYFNQSKDIIKRQLRFKQDILDMAHKEIDKALGAKRSDLTHRYIKIGVHVRRGDIAKNPLESGNCVAPVEFFNRSMDSMRSKYKGQNFVFIACSDGMDWVKSNIQGEDVVYANTKNAAADLAILSLCDAVIFASSTYGWWGAWLSGGPTIYYKNFPIPGTPYAKHYNYSDYYPPWWTGM